LQTNASESSTTVEDLDELEGTINDESVSDYYLEILSPCINKCEDFSLEGQVEKDYVLNFGFVSQETSIEKGKVYAMRMRTGSTETTGVKITSRAGNGSSSYSTNLDTIINDYETAYDDYYTIITAFSKSTAAEAKTYMGSVYKDDMEDSINAFYDLITKWPKDSDTQKTNKINLVDSILKAILFGGTAKMWVNSTSTSSGSTLATTSISLKGLIPAYDSSKTNVYQKLSNIAVKPTTSSDGTISYTKSDTNYLKYYLYTHLSSAASASVSAYSLSSVSQLTKTIVKQWKTTYIAYNKELVKRLNEDLDKLVIGEGSIDLQGNYSVDGTESSGSDTINKGSGQYISFKDIFNEAYYYVPSKDSDTSKSFIEPMYHNKSNGKWTWSTKAGATSVEDEAFFLFKANQNIANPYIGIKVESGPLKIVFDSITQNTYSSTITDGIQINTATSITTTAVEPKYCDGDSIKLVPITSYTTSETFRNAIHYDYTTETFTSIPTSFSWNDDYLLSSSGAWTGTTSTTSPLVDGTFLKNTTNSGSIAYLVFVNGECQGIIYLEGTE
jgi:hypothetical protein